MAASLVRGDPSGNFHIQAQPEDEVLCELNAEFGRSKTELIQRFLKDQEELNERFSEYALHSDEGEEAAEDMEGVSRSLTNQNVSHSTQETRGKGGLEVFDVLQDLEDRDLPDNFSTASVVNSGSDTPSLSDGDLDRKSYEDGDEEEYDENWNIPSDTLSISRHSKTGRAHESQLIPKYRLVPNQSVSGTPKDAARQKHQHTSHQLIPQPLPRRSKKCSKKDSEGGVAVRKAKKILVKKNVRPQTAMGVRGLHEDEGVLLGVVPPGPTPAPIYGLRESLSMVSARFKRISWMGGGEDHPEMGRLSISASVHRLPPRSHTPVGRFNSSTPSTLVPTSLSLRSGKERKRSTRQRQQGPPQLGSMSNNPGGSKQNLEVNSDLYRSASGRPDSGSSSKSRLSMDLSPTHASSRPDSGSSNKSRLSVDLSPTRVSGSHVTGPGRGPIMRGVYSAERNGRILVTPTLGDVKSSRRHIAVLKLPPLDSSVVNRAIGAVDPVGHGQPSLVSPATTKQGSVATPSAT